jgi:predicted transcriptional regulator
MTVGMQGSCSSKPEYSPYKVTKSNTTRLVLLQIAERPATIEEIASSAQIASITVASELEKLCKAGLVVRIKEGFAANFVILTPNPKSHLERLTHQKADIEVEIIQKHVGELRNVMQASSLRMKGWDWDNLCWVFVFAVLMDTGVVDRGFRRHGITTSLDAPERPGGERYWFFGMEGEPPYKWSFGQEVEFNENGGFAYWYEWRKTRPQFPKPHPMTFGKQGVNVMHTIHELDCSTVEEISEKVCTPASVVTEIIESGVTWGCVLIKGKRFRAHYPLFELKEIKDIVLLCDKISDKIIEECYLPLLPEIEQIRLKYYNENPALDKNNFVTNWGLWIREFALEKLIDEGVLPPFNAPQIAHFWGWKGSWEII